jgi:hypothetical protein
VLVLRNVRRVFALPLSRCLVPPAPRLAGRWSQTGPFFACGLARPTLFYSLLQHRDCPHDLCRGKLLRGLNGRRRSPAKLTPGTELQDQPFEAPATPTPPSASGAFVMVVVRQVAGDGGIRARQVPEVRRGDPDAPEADAAAAVALIAQGQARSAAIPHPLSPDHHSAWCLSALSYTQITDLPIGRRTRY